MTHAPECPERGLTAKQRRCIDLLLVSPSQAAAARRLGVDRKTVARWLALPAFVEALEGARARLRDRIVSELEAQGLAAVGTLAEVMKNRRVKPAARVAAAKALLTLALRDHDQADADDGPIVEEPTLENADRLMEELLGRYRDENGPGAPLAPQATSVPPAPLPSRGAPVPAQQRPRPRLVRLPLDPSDFGDLGPVTQALDEVEEPEPVEGAVQGDRVVRRL